MELHDKKSSLLYFNHQINLLHHLLVKIAVFGQNYYQKYFENHLKVLSYFFAESTVYIV